MPRTIQITDSVFVPGEAMRVTAARASGAGGQNVNKVSSKVDLRVDLDKIVGLSEGARARLLVAAKHRIDAEGKLQVVSQKTRDQPKNLDDACEKVRALIAAALIEPKRRRPTKPGRGAVERRLGEKRETSIRKAGRKGGAGSGGDD